MFIVMVIRETSFKEFDTTTKNSLALLQFPPYYAFGFTLLIAALVFGAVGQKGSSVGMRLRLFVSGLFAGALLLMVVDFVWVYGPLVEMLRTTEAARPANFQTYHKASMYINTVIVGICYVSWSWRRKGKR